jgi:hypothetical protein
MVSIDAFGKLVVEPKTLGWEHKVGTLQKDFKNLGIVLYFIEVFSENCVLSKWRKGGEGFIKRALCISVLQTNCLRATILPRYGMGPSPKLNYFSAGSLVLYKGRRAPESGLSQEVCNSVVGPPLGYLSGRHLGSPAVALELHSLEVGFQGLPGR